MMEKRRRQSKINIEQKIFVHNSRKNEMKWVKEKSVFARWTLLRDLRIEISFKF